MTFSLFNIRRHWFINDYPVVLTACNYFRCAVPSCPYCVLMKRVVIDGRPTFQFDRVVFSQHCHAFEGNKRSQTKDLIEHELRLISFGKDVDGLLREKHKEWQKQAAEDGKKQKEKLIKEKAAIDYACEHPMETGKQAEKASKNAMDRRAINMARKRKMEKEED